MATRLTVLGCSGSYFDATTGVPCSGYLVQCGEDRLLLDCGHGVYQQHVMLLREVGLDAVVISHSHGDHIGDLSLVARDRALWDKGPTLIANAASVVSFLQAEDFAADVAVQEVADGAEVQVGKTRLAFSETMHTVPTVACCIDATDGQRLLFSADTGPSWSPPAAFRRPDLLLVECSLAERTEEPTGRVHLSPEDVVELSSWVDARSVVVTHVPPGEDISQRCNAVQSRLECRVSPATVGLLIEF